MTQVLKEAEKDIEKFIEVYPAGELVSGILKLLKEPTPIKIALVSAESGDIAFTCSLSDLGLTQQTFHSHPFFRSNLWSNILGELLVRGNLNLFCDKVMDSSYNVLVRKFNHTGMGLRLVKNDVLMFQFHVSLIYKLLNESLTLECADELAKLNIISSSKKVKREDENPSITSYCDDKNNIRLIVPKIPDIRLCFMKAIQIILDFYGIKNKEVSITANMFNYEIAIKDEGKCSPK